MNTTSIASLHHAKTTGKMRPAVFLNRLRGAYRRWRENGAAMNELTSLSDYQLKDIGITRYDIARLVRRDGARDRAFYFGHLGSSL
jgi:uncharacterized protein YjiS (DUF1127 family)